MDIRDIEAAYFRLRSDLYRFLLSQTADRELAEDILQETIMELLRVHQNGAELKQDTFKGYLYTIAYSRIRQHRKHNHEKPEILLGTYSHFPSLRKEGDESLAIYIMVQNVLNDASLPPRVRLTLRLRLLDELSVEEILPILGVSRQSYYRDFRKGTRILRRLLEEKGLTPEDLP